MVVRRKKRKTNKFRGSKTHGWGSKKKHRGKGSRGGKGNAGMGKRGQQKLTVLYAEGKLPLGRADKGFTRHKSLIREKKYINVGDLELYLERFEAMGVAEKKGDVYSVDLEKAGYDKLLGAGKITISIEARIAEATPKAIRKVEAAGGKVVISSRGEGEEAIESAPTTE